MIRCLDFHQDYSPSGQSRYNLAILFCVICLAVRPTGHKKCPTGGVRRNHHSDSYPPSAKVCKSSCWQVSWLLAFAPHFAFPSRFSGQWLHFRGKRGYQLQWRDRAGLSPASLFSPDRSGQPNNSSRLLTENSTLWLRLSPNNNPLCQVWSIAIIASWNGCIGYVEGNWEKGGSPLRLFRLVERDARRHRQG